MNRAIQFLIIGAIVPVILVFWGKHGTYDFTHLWLGGKQVLSGDGFALYDPNARQALADLYLNGHETNFPYPPHVAFVFAPFALLPHLPSYIIWNLLTLSFFAWAARPYCVGWGILNPATLFCLYFGQTGLLIGGLWMLAFQGRWQAAAMLSVKPHIGFLALFTLRGKWLPALLLALAMAAGTALIFGPGVWLDFISHTIGHVEQIGERKRWLFAGVSPGIAYGMIIWILFAICAAIILFQNFNVWTAATAAVLISPYSFHYDMPAACLGLWLVIRDQWDDLPLHLRFPIALGFLSPVIALAGVWWVPPVLIWALWAQTKGVARESSVRTSTPVSAPNI